MRRSSTIHSVKPCLEQLEQRDQPSLLLSGNAVPQLAQPLNNMVQDMQNARTDLKTEYQTIVSFGIESVANPHFTADLPVAETAYGRAVGDWQRIVSDQHAIQAISNADVTFIATVAFSEFSQGDATDLVVLKYGPAFGINATAPLTNPVTQADNIFADPTLHADINADLALLSPLYTSLTIAEAAQTPSF